MPGILGGIKRRGVDGASRQLAQDIRLAQSNAITRGMQVRLLAIPHAGVVPSSSLIDASKANLYRLEVRTNSAASWPALSDTPGSNANVLTPWTNLGSTYAGVWVSTANEIAFGTLGSLTNSASSLTIVLQGPGGTRTIQTSPIGKVTIQ
jgi:Tfp pilus assembly protein FimT